MSELPLHKLHVEAGDGHHWKLLAVVPEQPRARLLWLPAMGVAARHYLPFALGLAQRGIATFIHDWRGNGTSSLRPSRQHDWGYREVLELDLPASTAVMTQHLHGLPQIIGGHSLGGQLACCHLGLNPDSATRLWLVASGSPYWRAFPPRSRWWLPMAYRFLPWLADRRGYLPGHRIGFGGNESRSLIHDWARSALSGRYAARGLDADLEAAMAPVRVDAHAVVLGRDWLAPASSTRFLLSKLPRSSHRIECLDSRALHARADHFAWMKQPQAVIDRLAAQDA
ncbi:alpha/beta hydrolase family protein [Lysobacter solisilvae (ex Woo and Kim 2020)]|uniref:Alpha/beta fold hydrolase n=1 Tax=Agrilutibacter terrestris TaxID=2865112 RepID=A0A7H0FWB2_9GAMM|nr:alpha/beta fold hydrolase [Lysobacter terrestris]QNP40328.1 alpha/beta fold hydrolase [Lysobacter terrestris]